MEKNQETNNMENFITITFAGSKEYLESLTSQLDELDLMTKTEEGSPTDIDGHVVKYQDVDGKDVFWAMIHSNQKDYLIRADKDLFESAEEQG